MRGGAQKRAHPRSEGREERVRRRRGRGREQPWRKQSGPAAGSEEEGTLQRRGTQEHARRKERAEADDVASKPRAA